MDLNLVFCIGVGVLVLALVLYLFRNVLAIMFGPVLGIIVYNRCQSPNRLADHALISLYLTAIRRLIEAIWRASRCLLPMYPVSTQNDQPEDDFYSPSDTDLD